MLRADRGLYGERSPDEIYRGLIWGYTAIMAAFIHDERLDNRWGTGGYYTRFYYFRSLSRGELYREEGRGKLTS